MERKNSKTMESLKAAFAGESMARNKYTFYAEVARKEGYPIVAQLFEETAENEKAHAEMHFKMLGELGDTMANLKAAAEGEEYEYNEMYPEFAKIAREEGENRTAALFELIAKVERRHAERFRDLLALVEKGQVFKKEEKKEWICTVCGHIHEGNEPPNKCPLCLNDKAVFEVFCECF